MTEEDTVSSTSDNTSAMKKVFLPVYFGDYLKPFNFCSLMSMQQRTVKAEVTLPFRGAAVITGSSCSRNPLGHLADSHRDQKDQTPPQLTCHYSRPT